MTLGKTGDLKEKSENRSSAHTAVLRTAAKRIPSHEDLLQATPIVGLCQ